MNKLFLIFMLFVVNVYSQDTLTIYFNLNEYKINNNEKLKIKELKNYAIQLIGYADYVYDSLYNLKLSTKRINEALKHIDSTCIITKMIPKGEVGTSTCNNEKIGCSENRKVEIIYLDKIAEVFPDKINHIVKKDSIKLESDLSKLQNMEIGQTLVFGKFNFYGGRHILLEDSKPYLLSLLKIMKVNPKLKIELQGHICCVDGPEDGLDFDTGEERLSENRAKAICDFLRKNGIEHNRLTYIGFGHQKPLYYPEKNDIERTTNRRVEIKVISK